MTITLTPEHERIIQAQIASGEFRSVDEVLDHFLGPLQQHPNTAQQPKSRKSAFGLLAEYGPGPSSEEIDENRREMFHAFAEDVP